MKLKWLIFVIGFAGYVANASEGDNPNIFNMLNLDDGAAENYYYRHSYCWYYPDLPECYYRPIPIYDSWYEDYYPYWQSGWYGHRWGRWHRGDRWGRDGRWRHDSWRHGDRWRRDHRRDFGRHRSWSGHRGFKDHGSRKSFRGSRSGFRRR